MPEDTAHGVSADGIRCQLRASADWGARDENSSPARVDHRTPVDTPLSKYEHAGASRAPKRPGKWSAFQARAQQQLSGPREYDTEELSML